jgi:hypothetical protein
MKWKELNKVGWILENDSMRRLKIIKLRAFKSSKTSCSGKSFKMSVLDLRKNFKLIPKRILDGMVPQHLILRLSLTARIKALT